MLNGRKSDKAELFDYDSLKLMIKIFSQNLTHTTNLNKITETDCVLSTIEKISLKRTTMHKNSDFYGKSFKRKAKSVEFVVQNKKINKMRRLVIHCFNHFVDQLKLVFSNESSRTTFVLRFFISLSMLFFATYSFFWGKPNVLKCFAFLKSVVFFCVDHVLFSSRYFTYVIFLLNSCSLSTQLLDIV